MEIRPDYYDSFKCIKDKCKHNCCIGWEIDIDEGTLQKYSRQTGKTLKKLQNSISLDPCPHFILSENERCPFLNDENLCELIIAGGEDMLCDICREHPRFYNYFDNITEKGIGLSCEEAARIILLNPLAVKLIYDGDVQGNSFLDERNEIFSILQNRGKPISDRISELLLYADVSLPLKEINWIEVLKGLERLDPAWESYLDSADISSYIPENLELPCEQLLCYFIYRHLGGCMEDLLFEERIQFAVLSCYVIVSLNRTKTIDEMLEVARMYSSEIEYSDENIEVLLDLLNEYNNTQI